MRGGSGQQDKVAARPERPEKPTHPWSIRIEQPPARTAGTARFVHLLIRAMRIAHPMENSRSAWRRLRFLLLAWRHRPLIEIWLNSPDADLPESVLSRPEMIGAVEWPYLHKDWPVPRRFEAIRAHYAEVVSIAWMRIGIQDTRTLSELDDIAPGLRIVLDRPHWFLREGELTLNLFLQEERVYSLSFSLARVNGERTAYIGGLQGRNLDEIESVYRDMTKKLHGARPRDFLFSAFQIACQAAGVTRVLGVSDACRHHRHPYFGAKAIVTPGASYDEVWRDRGGKEAVGGFFELPTELHLRAVEEIPSRKRSMYRRRYALYDRMRADIARIAGATRGMTTERAVAAL